MNAHVKTILTIVISIIIITFLCYHPTLSWHLYQGLFGLIGIAACAMIYEWIYMCFYKEPKAIKHYDTYFWGIHE